MLAPPTCDVPCALLVKVPHGSPAFKGYHISPASFARLFLAALRGLGGFLAIRGFQGAGRALAAFGGS
jgi:hypothetical protein